jgi:hypothetical protein
MTILRRAVAAQRTAFYRCHIHGNEYRRNTVTATTDMRFRGNQPRTMHFGRVRVGDHYSVSPEATLGPTQGPKKRDDKRRRENE